MSILGGSIPATPSFRSEQKGLDIPGKSSEPSLIQRLDLISKKSADVGVSILGGTVRLQYWESILQDSVRASVIFTDTGNTLPRKKTRFGSSKSGKVGVVEGLPVEGGEKTFLKAEGLLATCIQHEMDHLQGILFIDYLSKLKKTMIIKKLSKQKSKIDRIVV